VNFDERDGRCIACRESERRDLGDLLAGAASLECRVEQRAGGAKPRVVCVLSKRQ
jgi:hypothetical protein